MNLNVKNTLPVFIIIALSAALWLPNLFTKGMFVDGVYNALYAHKLANGVSTFWRPETVYYSEPAAWGSAPLSALFLAGFYKIFGDYYYMDKVYSMVCALIQLGLLNWTWRIFFRGDTILKSFSWLPCILWLLSPFTSWCYSSNLMENTMSVFTTLALISFLLFREAQGRWWLYAATGAVCTFLAVLAKGPVGLYPLAMPLFFLIGKDRPAPKRVFLYAWTQLLFFIGVFAVVFSMEMPRIFLMHYIDEQLKPSIGGVTVRQFEILLQVFIMLWPALLFAVVSFIRTRDTRNNFLWNAGRFIAIGLSASLPIILSEKQRNFYLLPSLVPFIIGLSLVVLPSAITVMLRLESSIYNRAITAIKVISVAVVTVCVFLCVKKSGTYLRDEALLKDLENMQPLLGTTRVIRADWKMYDDWTMRAYLDRYYDQKICMPGENAITEFHISKSGQETSDLPANTRQLYSGTVFHLYSIQKQ